MLASGPARENTLIAQSNEFNYIGYNLVEYSLDPKNIEAILSFKKAIVDTQDNLANSLLY